MLKSNSKQAIERIKDYVCNHVNFDYDSVNEKYYYVMDLEKRHENGENIEALKIHLSIGAKVYHLVLILVIM